MIEFIFKFIFLTILILFFGVLIRRDSASNRHLAWAISFGLIVLLPAFYIFLPIWEFAVVVSSEDQLLYRIAKIERWISAELIWLVGIYFIGCMYFCFIRFLKIDNTRKLIRQSNSNTSEDIFYLASSVASNYELNSNIQIYISSAIRSPFTFGWKSPIIMLPHDFFKWQDAEKLNALRHELAHIKRADWLIQQIAYGVCVLYWPIPTVWMLLHKLEHAAEYSADDMASGYANRSTEYARSLVEVAKRSLVSKQYAAVNMTDLEILTGRVNAALDGRQQRHVVYPSLAIIYGMFFVLLVGFFASGRFDIYMIPRILTKVLPVPGAQSGWDYEKVPIWATAPNLPMIVVDRPSELVPPVQRIDVQDSFSILSKENIVANDMSFSYQNIQSSNKEQLRANKIYTPIYPSRAVTKRTEGFVTLEYRVDEFGQVKNVQIVDQLPKGIFDAAALQAIEKFHFVPSKINGAPISTWRVRTTFDFRLFDDDHGPPSQPSVLTEISTH